jgi:hypothetical protein
VIESLYEIANVITNKNGYSSKANLPVDGILILPTPRDTIIDEKEFDLIVEWVRQGGSLLVMGIYLVEVHHGNNINKLAQRFGFEFKDNLMMPKGIFGDLPLGTSFGGGTNEYGQCMGQAYPVIKSDSCILSRPLGDPESHPLLDNVSTLALTSCCSIECLEDPDLKVTTSDSVAILHATGIKNRAGRLARIEEYVLNGRAPAQFMVAFRYEAGKVIGIGTWKVFLNQLVSSYPEGNRKLFHNIIDWLQTG